ncbi:hypothetical protein AB0I72_07025 [Nocardiopsis sp. NPDC049922]|uniref:hypothetical protein n=1 Tax=Nocardiopsis sp. NPDC049922 TaxID=3155157 RepID=UPI0033E4C8FA
MSQLLHDQVSDARGDPAGEHADRDRQEVQQECGGAERRILGMLGEGRSPG